MILQPTSPLRTFNDINNALKLVRKFKPNSLFSISESIEHPYETISKSKKNWKLIVKTKKKFTRRQDFGLESFFINGAIYIAHRKLIKKKILYGKSKNILYKMKKSKSIEIDDIEEAKIISALLKR